MATDAITAWSQFKAELVTDSDMAAFLLELLLFAAQGPGESANNAGRIGAKTGQ